MPWSKLFQRKSLDSLVHETVEPQYQLKRALGPVHLTLLGVGGIIGAGIFSTVGTAAAGGSEHIGAGPALVLSFVLVAIACGFAALCYCEFAAMVPVSGSAYTYAYATLGELLAWIIGWDLILEYAVGNVAVAIGWSDYFQSLLAGFSLPWPAWLGTDVRSALQAAKEIAAAKASGLDLSTLGATVLRNGAALEHAPRFLGLPIVFNLPAVLIVALITWVLVRGIRESATFNSAMVIVKLLVIGLFVGVGAFYVKPENWTPFAPTGFAGISSAAAIIFFAYIGFDAISTAAEETRNPQRNMPIGILASLAVCTVIYVAVALVLTGMVKWDRFSGVADPLAMAFQERGMNWTAGVISFGAVFATTSVLLVFQLGQPRIFFSMARDGLLPQWAAKVHRSIARSRDHDPYRRGRAGFAAVTYTMWWGICTSEHSLRRAVAAGFMCAGEGTRPGRRSARVGPSCRSCDPSCAWLLFVLPWIVGWRFIRLAGVGLCFYLIYGFTNSRLRHAPPPPRS